MKHISIAALGTLALMLTLTGCGRSAPSSSGVQTSATSTASAPIVKNAEATSTAAPPDVQAQVSAAEQVTETGGSESVESSSSAQPLALRIAELKPEPPSQWKEGTHYNRLIPVQPTNAAPGQIEVTEMFWYGCPHCFALDPYLESWRKAGRANYISFVRVPVMWGAVHRTHARVYYAADMLGKLEALHPLIFQEIHQNNDPLTEPDQIEKFFISHGVAQADFQKVFSSFAVETSLKRAETLGLRYKVDSVPLIVINGKYVTDVGRAGSPQQLIALINELASRERGT
jgi:thiol:disulfide interchange protein DsbA